MLTIYARVIRRRRTLRTYQGALGMYESHGKEEQKRDLPGKTVHCEPMDDLSVNLYVARMQDHRKKPKEVKIPQK